MASSSPFLGYAGITTLDLFGASLAGIRSKRGAMKSRERLVRKRRGLTRRLDCLSRSRTQRSSWSTLCCDWLASDSAETAIDWRGGTAPPVGRSPVGVGTRQVGGAACDPPY